MLTVNYGSCRSKTTFPNSTPVSHTGASEQNKEITGAGAEGGDITKPQHVILTISAVAVVKKHQAQSIKII